MRRSDQDKNPANTKRLGFGRHLQPRSIPAARLVPLSSFRPATTDREFAGPLEKRATTKNTKTRKKGTWYIRLRSSSRFFGRRPDPVFRCFFVSFVFSWLLYPILLHSTIPSVVAFQPIISQAAQAWSRFAPGGRGAKFSGGCEGRSGFFRQEGKWGGGPPPPTPDAADARHASTVADDPAPRRAGNWRKISASRVDPDPLGSVRPEGRWSGWRRCPAVVAVCFSVLYFL